MKKVCCQLSPFSHTQVRRDPYTNLVRLKNGNQVATWKTKESLFSLKDEESKFSLKSELRSRSTNFKPSLIVEDRDLREAHIKSLHEIEELKRVQELRVDEFSRRRLIENQDTTNELTARIQELQNEVNCMNDSRDFKDAESARSGLFHVPSQPALFPPHRDSGGLLSRNDKPSGIWNTHGISGHVFANPPASSSSPYPGGFNSRISNITEDASPHVTSERQISDTALDTRCQSGSSAKDSVIFSGGDSSKNYGADQQRLQVLDLHFDMFPTPATFACWKIRFKTEVCTCSQFPTEAMQWIKEVEMVIHWMI